VNEVIAELTVTMFAITDLKLSGHKITNSRSSRR
jgi:hypothetical protein